ncbi:MAG: SDR family NAD(P)-dependent oxidoreductase [Clostridia bacterium]
MHNNIVVITGGSSGIGKATSEYFSSKGSKVYEISRHGENNGDIVHLCADITDKTAVQIAINEIIRIEGNIDILINNAGFGISGAVEFTDTEEAKRLFDVNFFGMLNVTNCVIAYMRSKRNGMIINISSVAGVLSIPYQSFYSAAKAATNSLTNALANELKPFNIKVTALMPGDIHTEFTKHRNKNIVGDDIYCGRIGRSVAAMEQDELNGMSPNFIAQNIYKLSQKKSPKSLYVAGGKYKLFTVLAKLLPIRLSNSIIGSIYNK